MPPKCEKIVRYCETCNRSFEIFPCQLKGPKHPGRFCSVKCRGIASRNMPGKTRRLPSTDLLIKEYSEGSSLKKMADKYGVTRQAIYYHLRRANHARRKLSGGWHYMSKEGQEKNRQANRARGGDKSPHYKPLPQEIGDKYLEGMTTQQLAAEYNVSSGCIEERLESMGIPRRKAGFSVWRKCHDGHIVQSGWEKAIDNWLFQNNISHAVHPPLPWNKKLHADFLIDSVYIEIWGVVNSKLYETRKARKLSEYEANMVSLIQIYPHDILSGAYKEILMNQLSHTKASCGPSPHM